MSTVTIPTSGVARRRTKAIVRRRRIHALENNLAVAAGRLPVHWTALYTCPCGYVSWLEEDATDEERQAFDNDSGHHDAFCDGAA